MSTARLLGKCSTAGGAKGVDLTVENLMRIHEMKSQFAEMLKACGGVEVVKKRNDNSQNKKWLPYFINRADQTMIMRSPISKQG
jgi:hypothetical protein